MKFDYILVKTSLKTEELRLKTGKNEGLIGRSWILIIYSVKGLIY